MCSKYKYYKVYENVKNRGKKVKIICVDLFTQDLHKQLYYLKFLYE